MTCQKPIKKIVYLIFLLNFVLGTTNGQNGFESSVQKFLLHPDYKNASLGISIADLENGETVYSYRAEKLLIPASTLKLITSAAALEILGDDYRFKTKISYTGKIKEGVLKGNLIVVGGGDPVLGSEYFKEHYFTNHFIENWVQKVKAAGISQINGDLVFDSSNFSTEKVPPTWIWEDLGNYYGAAAGAFSAFDNVFRISFRSPPKAGQPTKIISVWPQIEGLSINNQVLSSNKNKDLAYVFGSPLDKLREIRGTIPKNRKAFTIKASIPNPAEVLANEFFAKLAQNGVFITGKIKFETGTKKKYQELYVQQSPELSEIVKVLNHQSVNLIAEHLVKQIAFVKTGFGDRETGIEIIRNFWKEKGLETQLLFMEDGSGLSHFNAVAPAFFSHLLLQMKNKKTFIESLPEAGKGTLYNFNPKNFGAGGLRAKSGSMTRVRCYAGYLVLKSGREVCFSIMLNHFSGSHTRLINEIEKLLVSAQNSL